MEVCDYSRSFLTFVTEERGNNARIQLDARCELFPEDSDKPVEFVLGASCKSEDTYAPENLFLEPNYDFCPIFSDTEYAIIRTYASAEPDEVAKPDGVEKPCGMAAGLITDSFLEVPIHRETVPGARVLADNAEIVQATLNNEPLVGRVEIIDNSGQPRALLEFPIKTMNVNDIEDIFQVDTGPLLLPDLDWRGDLRVECFRRAFVAYNTFEGADFVAQRPTPTSDTDAAVRVYHYSKMLTLPTRNWVISLGAIG